MFISSLIVRQISRSARERGLWPRSQTGRNRASARFHPLRLVLHAPPRPIAMRFAGARTPARVVSSQPTFGSQPRRYFRLQSADAILLSRIRPVLGSTVNVCPVRYAMLPK